jgi:hypothetical protein
MGVLTTYNVRGSTIDPAEELPPALDPAPPSSGLDSPFSRLFFSVSRLPSPVPRLFFSFSRLPSPVSRLWSRVS